MRVLLGKSNNFVLDRRAVSRADTVNMSAIHRRFVQVGPDDLVRFSVGMRDATSDLPRLRFLRKERKHYRLIIARLLFEPFPIDRRSVQPRRSTRLETTERKFEAVHSFSKSSAGLIAHPASTVGYVANMHSAAKEGAGRQYN